LEVRFKVDPAQMGELDDTVGVAGIGLTVTATEAEALVHPETVTVAE
jgi:hypothetical protein